MSGLFKTPADNVIDGINRDKGVLIHVQNNSLELVDFKARHDTIQNLFALASVAAFAVQERNAASEFSVKLVGDFVGNIIHLQRHDAR